MKVINSAALTVLELQREIHSSWGLRLDKPITVGLFPKNSIWYLIVQLQRLQERRLLKDEEVLPQSLAGIFSSLKAGSLKPPRKSSLEHFGSFVVKSLTRKLTDSSPSQ